VYKNRSGLERGDPMIIPPLRNRPVGAEAWFGLVKSAARENV
jgi:hypothetical protein